MPDAPPRLDDYVLLGRSGLRVSRLCLGTMTFGTEWGWGSAESAAREMFDRYLDAGGNFIDTADGYTGGTSETLVGKFIRDRGNRDRVVLATKFTFAAEQGNPNAGGNGRKNIHRALEGSLRRLQTDYVDLYWLHAWDGLTPMEEVLSTLDALVRAGKVRAVGFSDVPAWYLARAQTIAEFRGLGADLRAPARVLAGGAQHRAGARARRARPRRRHLPLEPAGQRHAEREVPARPHARGPGTPRGHPAVRRTPASSSSSPSGTGRSSRRWWRWRRRWGAPPRRWP